MKPLANKMTAPARASVKFKERAELLDYLLDVSRVTSETFDFQQLLESVAGIVKQVVPYDLFAILLYSERSQGMRIRYSIGHRQEIVRSLHVKLGEGIVGQAGYTRQAILVDDVHAHPEYLPSLDAIRCEIAVPMLARNKLVGVIDLQSTQRHIYAAQDKSLLTLIASRVAASVDNASLFRRVERQNRTMRTLVGLSQEFSSILELDELLTRIAGIVRALINYDAFSIYLLGGARSELKHRFSVRYDERVHLDNIPFGKGLTGSAAESRESVRVADTSADPRYIASHLGIRSELAVPLITQDRVVGVLDVESERVAFFTEDHQRTLTLLAPQIASAIENARLYEELAQREQRMDQDLKAARKVQRILLPREAPPLPGIEVAVRSRPAREISGDVYDFFELGGDALIAFGDVSGKGAAAALYGAVISGLLRTLGPRRKSPSALLQSLNEELLERKVEAQYATLVVALWRPDQHKLTFANAGHGPPFIIRHGEWITASAEGVPIGLLEDRQYDETTVILEPGDIVLLYSDGFEDQLDATGQEYTRPRVGHVLRETLKDNHARTPREIIDAIFTDLDAFRQGTAITDDQSLVAIRVSE